MKITNLTQKNLLASNTRIAGSFFSRLVGLIGRKSLGASEALVITRCQSIHMFFMRFPIDVVFIDEKNRVVGLVKNIKPFQMSPVFWKADRAVELPQDTISRLNTKIGDNLLFED